MSNNSKTYKIGEVASLAKVSVRALHHYDAIGLLKPKGRSDSGYRLYSQDDLERLQQILFYKTLEFSLEEINHLMSDPDFSRHTALFQQRKLINAKATQLNAALKLIDKTIAQIDGSINEEIKMTNEAMFEVFTELSPEHLDEADKLWGASAGYQAVKQRYKQYNKAELELIKTEAQALDNVLLVLMDNGVSADDQQAIAAIESMRLLTEKWEFSPCPKELHLQMLNMVFENDRFNADAELSRAGKAEYLIAAAKANLANSSELT